jgi:UDP-glucose 4-epimerase
VEASGSAGGQRERPDETSDPDAATAAEPTAASTDPADTASGATGEATSPRDPEVSPGDDAEARAPDTGSPEGSAEEAKSAVKAWEAKSARTGPGSGRDTSRTATGGRGRQARGSGSQAQPAARRTGGAAAKARGSAAQAQPGTRKARSPGAGTSRRPTRTLTVAITGPTGEIGRALIGALERSDQVSRIRGMARRPFDPDEHGWRKVEYRQGDVLDRDAVDGLAEGADVVVHLAFIIFGDPQESRSINVEGSRNVFEAAVDAGAQRLVYASSVAAYGFHGDNPPLLSEDVPPRGTGAHYYSAQKAELESVLAGVLADSPTAGYVFRPCIVAGPEALMLIHKIPYVEIARHLPAAVRRLLDAVPVLKPVLPDPGVPFQLVHHDDVATALQAAVLGRGEPGVYNLAGDGSLTVTDLAEELGWYALPVPDLAVDAAAEVLARLPLLPPEASWINAFRAPVLMDTSRAREQLGWEPGHSSRETLRATVQAARGEGLIG